MEIRGFGIEVEEDELAFRRKAEKGKVGQLGANRLRYTGFDRHGSSKIFQESLTDRWVKNSGQGGGGTLPVEELRNVLSIS